ncbi:MAG: glycosyltransferase family 2 protein [Oscillospiraceae bacterium]|nr:glycosyltransferase family 2 protein [Oscillospiraceae bacterium]
MMLSIILPAYNEEQMVEKAAAVIGHTLRDANIPYEIIFVDDGSLDDTWNEIVSVSERNENVRGVHFSRNFGKEAAIMAGLTESSGDCCVVMDCDLQHPPEKILEMYQLWQQGYEVIEGQKRSRGAESAFHAWAARRFYALISAATGFDMSSASDFKLLDRKAVDVLIHMHERNAFFRALSSWIGFKTASVSFDVQEREAGVSKWSTKSLVKYAISNISSFSAVPMQIVTILGAVMFVISCVFGCIALVQKFTGRALAGFTTVILILLFSSSIIMISLGIIGYYIARMYDEIKGRPRYIIASTCGEKARSSTELCTFDC